MSVEKHFRNKLLGLLDSSNSYMPKTVAIVCEMFISKSNYFYKVVVTFSSN